jgi:cell division septal protein FtsQ
MFFRRRTRQSESRPTRYRTYKFRQRVKKAKAYHRKLGKIDYNPGRTIAFRLKALSLLAFLVTAVCVYFTVFSSYFLVNVVQVNGSLQIDNQAVSEWFNSAGQEKVYGLIPQNHMLVLSDIKIEQLLKSHSPYIFKLVQTSRIWPNRLSLKVEDRSPIAIWSSGGRFFYIDSSSVIYDEVAPDYAFKTRSFLTINAHPDAVTQAGTDLELAQTLQFILEAKARWDRVIPGEIRQAGLISESGREVYLESEEGWRVNLDTASDPIHQINSLAIILTKAVTPARRGELAYVDLRVPGIAYYCLTGEPCLAQTDEEFEEGLPGGGLTE